MDSEDRIRVIYVFRLWSKLNGGAMEEKSCFAIKGGSPQIRRKYDNANAVFDGKEVPSIKDWSLHIFNLRNT